MKIAALYRYPVKSLGGQSLTSVKPDSRGFPDDRRWMFVDANGRFISQRNNVQLARFSAEVTGDELLFRNIASAELVGAVAGAREGGKCSVTVWDDTFTATQIESDALYALTRVLGIPDARLVYMREEDERPIDPDYAKAWETVSFADGFPYLVTTTASLRFVAERLNGFPVSQERFRPNIVVDTQEPWLEDHWKELDVNGQRFKLPKPCARCIMVTHEPGTGDRAYDVLKVLNEHRKVGNRILFGMNASWTGGNGRVIRVGDPVVAR